ncbi:MAG: hypothetical protein EON93_07670 [Burkholderiales bacterium]|nr:MAG: hypothetical protein EON93_07670 [Burkholderiales bacterium]
MKVHAIAVLLLVGITLCACQSGRRAAEPALLMQGDSLAMQRLMSTLATEMKRTPIDLGPSDPTRSPVISVLPLPPGLLDDRSLALPTTFRLEWDGETCWLIRDDTRVRHELDGVTCRSAGG